VALFNALFATIIAIIMANHLYLTLRFVAGAEAQGANANDIPLFAGNIPFYNTAATVRTVHNVVIRECGSSCCEESRCNQSRSDKHVVTPC
jgi:hypothetical protein